MGDSIFLKRKWHKLHFLSLTINFSSPPPPIQPADSTSLLALSFGLHFYVILFLFCLLSSGSLLPSYAIFFLFTVLLFHFIHLIFSLLSLLWRIKGTHLAVCVSWNRRVEAEDTALTVPYKHRVTCDTTPECRDNVVREASRRRPLLCNSSVIRSSKSRTSVRCDWLLTAVVGLAKQ
jgi:hypothetical protein